jgi:CubicO group peptidase (beta-lactamase class C family)
MTASRAPILRIALAFACTACCAPTVVAAADCAWAPAATAFADEADAKTIARIEADVRAAMVSQREPTVSLQTRMRAQQVPAVSVAVVDRGEVAWAAAWGVRDVGGCAPVTTETRFQAASISKPVAAATALALAARGALDLDAPVAGTRDGWRLPRADGIDGFPTLRQLLSHTGGIDGHGFQGYAPEGTIPTVRQVLSGDAPANSGAVTMTTPAGTAFRYSGGGYTLAQAAMADAGARDFASLAQRHVFDPLGMIASGYLAPATQDRASGHSNGETIGDGYRVHPEQAAAGLWTTPTDLARFAISLQRARAGERGAFDPALARAMLTPAREGYGLGVFIEGDGAEMRFGHDGVNYGFEAKLVAGMDDGRAIVVMTNAQGGQRLAQSLIGTIAETLGWTALAPRRVSEVATTADDRAALVGHYQAPGWQVRLDDRGARLGLIASGEDVGELIAIGEDRYVLAAMGLTLAVRRDGGGAVQALEVIAGGPPLRLERGTDPMLRLGNAPLFLRGSMNDWGIGPRFDAQGPDFVADATLAAGVHSFKLASEDWSTMDLGAAGPAAIAPGAVLPLAFRGSNITLNIVDAGTYRFRLVRSGDGATLQVTKPR